MVAGREHEAMGEHEHELPGEGETRAREAARSAGTGEGTGMEWPADTYTTADGWDGVYRDWYYDERPCRISKHYLGHWCGYTRTTLSFDVDIEHLPGVEVPVALTYGPDDDGWVGFDCAHAGEMCLDESGERWGRLASLPVHGIAGGEPRVWRLPDVKETVEALADDLSTIERLVALADHREGFDLDANFEPRRLPSEGATAGDTESEQ